MENELVALETGRARIIESMGGPPWSAFEIIDPQESYPGPDVGCLTYKVRAVIPGATLPPPGRRMWHPTPDSPPPAPALNTGTHDINAR